MIFLGVGRILHFGTGEERAVVRGLADRAPYGEPVFGIRIDRAVQGCDQFVIHFHAGDPCAFGNRMVGHGGTGGHHMFDVVCILEVRSKRGRNDAALGMTDHRHRFVRTDACPFHGFGHHAGTIGLHALLGIRTHEFTFCGHPNGESGLPSVPGIVTSQALDPSFLRYLEMAMVP